MNAYELTRTDSICPTPESELLDSVRNNEIHKVRSLIRENPKLLSFIYPHPYNKPILYIACFEFAEEDQILPSTVQTLINLGADLYYADEADDYREALHFATESQNPAILETVIQNLDAGRINATSNGNTALNLLVKKGKVDSKHFERCLKLLLSADGMDCNKADGKNVTPILWAAHKDYRNVVSIILNSANYVDIDTHKIKQKTARALILEKNLYAGNLPDAKTNNNESPKEILFRYVKEGREDDFVQFPNIKSYVDDEEDEGTLLQRACKLNRKKIVDHLILNNAIVTKRTQKNLEYPLEIVARRGYHKIFCMLLDQYSGKIPDDVLTILLVNNGIHTTAEIDHQKCLDALLDKENISLNVNAKDENGNSALHYSTRYADADTTLRLLKQGASLGNSNKFGFLPVEDVDPQTLEQHFDDCISAEPKIKFDKQGTVLTFNYKTLVPTKAAKPISDTLKQSDLEANFKLLSDEIYEMVSETEVVYTISKTPELRHLLKHPLITSFLYMKWHRMSWFFYTNLIFYVTFCFSLVLYIFLTYSDDILDDYPALAGVTTVLLVVTFIVLALREFFQILVSPKTYFAQFENWIEITLIVVTFFILFQKSPQSDTVRQLSSVAILLAALEMMLLIGQHPKMSTYIAMLRTVSYNFFKFLLWYAILILAFALSFYKLFNKENGIPDKLQDNSTKINEDAEQDFFIDPSLAIIKTIVMLTGEFDASNINFEPLPNRIIFLLFVFMISIILFNLLNGLAVSDMQMIKSNAEIVGHVERVNHIVYIENMMLGNIVPTNVFIIGQKLCCCLPNNKLRKLAVPKSLAKLVCLFPNFLKNHRLEVYLNQEGKVIREDSESRTGCLRKCGGIYLEKKTIKRVKLMLQERKYKNQVVKQSVLLKEKEELIKDLQQIIKSQQEIINKLILN